MSFHLDLGVRGGAGVGGEAGKRRESWKEVLSFQAGCHPRKKDLRHGSSCLGSGKAHGRDREQRSQQHLDSLRRNVGSSVRF